MNTFAKVVAWALVVASLQSTAGAETLEQLIAGAKKESEITFHRRGADFWRAEDFEYP